MKRSQIFIAPRLLVALALATSLLAACNGGDDNAKTPPPTATWTPSASDVIIPGVESNSGPSGVQVSPLATPDPASPLPFPTPTP